MTTDETDAPINNIIIQLQDLLDDMESTLEMPLDKKSLVWAVDDWLVRLKHLKTNQEVT